MDTKSQTIITENEAQSLIDEALLTLSLDYEQVATLAGNNYRSRQSIKRKATRWAENFSAMPTLERLAILSAIAQHNATLILPDK